METYFGFILRQGKIDGMQDELAYWLAPSGLCVIWGDSRRRPLDSQKQTSFTITMTRSGSNSLLSSLLFSLFFFFIFLVAEYLQQLLHHLLIPLGSTTTSDNMESLSSIRISPVAFASALQNNHSARDIAMAH